MMLYGFYVWERQILDLYWNELIKVYYKGPWLSIIFASHRVMNPSQQLFPNATKSYPEFFKTNLVDPNRVIKIVEGKYCAVRAFYYQLLKLIFEIDSDNDGEQIDYLQLLTTHMERMLSTTNPQDDHDNLRDQVHNIHIFLNGVFETGDTHFESILNRNPQADKAFLAVFSQILRQRNLQNASVEQKIGYLSQLFHQQVSYSEKCIKFSESDVFVYVQSQKLLYLAYLQLESPEPQLVQNSIDRGIYSHRQEYEDTNLRKGKNNDTIINIFGDMLHSSQHDGLSKQSNSFITNNLNSSLSPGKREEQVITSMKIKPKYPFQSERVPDVYVQDKTADNGQFKKHQSNVEKYMGTSTRSRQQKSDTSPEDILYRPKTKLPTISQVTSSKESLIYSHKHKKDPLDIVDDDEKGTFYRQFTNTRILNILPEPQRTNVKMLRNRFIGVHTRDLKKQ